MKKTVRTLIVMVISVLMLTIATIPAMAADFDSETTNDNVSDFIKQMCKELKECNYKGNIISLKPQGFNITFVLQKYHSNEVGISLKPLVSISCSKVKRKSVLVRGRIFVCIIHYSLFIKEERLFNE
ncbi:MAG: hypothetical protein IKY18_05500 [Oscillospiraceae bacterium]|nr:hypothetical protein [Oscillospiraceae bacterium]